MKLGIESIAAALFGALLFSTVAAAQSGSALVLSAPELDEDTAFSLETRLRSVASSLLPDLLGRSQTRALVESTRAVGVRCAPNNPQCLTELGLVLGVPTYAYLDVRPTSGGFTVSGALVDVGSASVRRAITTDVGPALLSERAGPEVRRVVFALLAPERTGSLLVTVSPPAATITVDGERLPTPSEPVIGLVAGSHVVEVALEGYQRHQEVVSVDAGKQTELTLELHPREPGSGARAAGASDHSPWYLAGGTAGLGAGILVAVAGGGLGYWGALASAEVPSKAGAAERQEAANASSLYGGVAVGSVVAGATLIAAGAALLTTGFIIGGE